MFVLPTGQAGGNIGYELFKRGLKNMIYLNTAKPDILSNELPEDKKVHFPNTTGCAKKRKLGLSIAEANDEMIMNIVNQYSFATILMIPFSLGGGTGSSIGVYMARRLREEFPNKTIVTPVVFPSDDESLQTFFNTMEAYQELLQIPNINIIPICNNSKGSKLEINRIFAENFNTFISSPKPNAEGNIDYNEILTMLELSGVTIMGKLENAVIKNNVHPVVSPSARYMLLSKNGEEIDIPRVQENYGFPRDTFNGLDAEDNFLVCGGMSPYLERLKELQVLIQEGKAKMKKPKGFFLEIPSLDDDNEEIEMEQTGSLDQYLYKKE